MSKSSVSGTDAIVQLRLRQTLLRTLYSHLRKNWPCLHTLLFKIQDLQR